jgi:putative FmdB family regulatory protein
VLSDLHGLGTPGSRLGWSRGVQHREEASGCLMVFAAPTLWERPSVALIW